MPHNNHVVEFSPFPELFLAYFRNPPVLRSLSWAVVAMRDAPMDIPVEFLALLAL